MKLTNLMIKFFNEADSNNGSERDRYLYGIIGNILKEIANNNPASARAIALKAIADELDDK
jgi:hypothetical protein